jgi:hypothetical protein
MKLIDRLWDIVLVVFLIAFLANLIYGGISHVVR